MNETPNSLEHSLPDPPMQVTWGQLMAASALGFIISLLLLLPPIIHLCSGPLGPLVGGLVGGNWTKAQPKEGLYIGLGMGVCAALVAGTIATLQASLLYSILAIGAVAYVGLLGTLGAILGGYMTRQG